MTRSTRPRTFHQLQEYALGRPLTRKEKLFLKDRPLTPEEQSALRKRRMAIAERDRSQPQHVTVGLHATKPNRRGEQQHNYSGAQRTPWRAGKAELTVGFFRNAMRRFERWARSAEKRGLDKARPPAHIADKAVSVTRMIELARQQETRA